MPTAGGDSLFVSLKQCKTEKTQMSRQAQQVAFANGLPVKLTPANSAKDDAPDLHVLEIHPSGSSPDIHLQGNGLEEELGLARAEIADLRSQIEQNEQLLQAAVASEESWLERQKEYELLLEEKSDVIRDLHHTIQELKDGSAGDNFAKAEELKELKRELEERRKQLAEDEAGLVNQMREMELALSRDRAELARQRNDLQRLQSEIQREIEIASRDAGLRERLANIVRRQPDAVTVSIKPPQPKPEAPHSPASVPPKTQSGLFRRIFGGGS